ncbi:aldo/keto reductase [bacterium]|nr:aldo/keto reductase [bacterium]
MSLPQIEFGTTGFKVSPLGVGAVKWGRTEGLKHTHFKLPDDRTIIQLLEMAIEAGINVLDTAAAYGISEMRIGKLLEPFRGHFHIFTKAGEIFENGKSRWDFSDAGIRTSVEKSLIDLKIETLDLLTLHCSPNDVETLKNSPALSCMAELKAEGKARNIGVSSTTVEGGLYALPLVDVIMVAWNPGFTDHQQVIEKAATLKKGILIKKALNSGNMEQHVNSAEYGLKSAFGLPGKPLVLVGTINPDHLRENILIATRYFSTTIKN